MNRVFMNTAKVEMSSMKVEDGLERINNRASC